MLYFNLILSEVKRRNSLCALVHIPGWRADLQSLGLTHLSRAASLGNEICKGWGDPVDTVPAKLQVSTLQAALGDLRFSDGHIKREQ